MWVTNWARRHTKRVVQRLVEYGLSSSESGIELRFFDVNTKDQDKSFEFEYVTCRLSPEEAMKLGADLQARARAAQKPAPVNGHEQEKNSWRCW